MKRREKVINKNCARFGLDHTSLKKAKLESVQWEGPDTGPYLPLPREPFKHDTVNMAPGAIEGAGGVFS